MFMLCTIDNATLDSPQMERPHGIFHFTTLLVLSVITEHSEAVKLGRKEKKTAINSKGEESYM